MPGLLHPSNFAPDNSFDFKEGFVRVDSSLFKVQRPFEPKVKTADWVADPDFMALVWSVTRLDENLEPMTDSEDNPLSEDLGFKLGKKSLSSVHPGGASSIDDTEVEDMGVAPNAAGPTLSIKNSSWQLHPKSGLANLLQSVNGKVDEKIYDRICYPWAPEWNGAVLFLKSRPSEDKIAGKDGVERPYNIIFVDKVVKMGGGVKGSVKGSGGAGKAGGDAQAIAARKALDPILEALSSECAGETLTAKALQNRVSQALKKNNVDAKLHVPILGLVKDEAWLAKNGANFDMTFDADAKSVTFGSGE